MGYLSELSDIGASDNAAHGIPPAPIIPPLNPVDTPLTPGDTVSQIIAYSSPWIDLCSPDPLIANISRQVLNIEIAYASFCGVGNIVIPGPRAYSSGSTDNDGLIQYARAIQSTQHWQLLADGDSYPNVWTRRGNGNKEIDLYETWDAWNLIRSVCKYSARLSVGK